MRLVNQLLLAVFAGCGARADLGAPRPVMRDAAAPQIAPPIAPDAQPPVDASAAPDARGDELRVLAVAEDGFYEVVLPGGVRRQLAQTEPDAYADVALTHDGRTLYAVAGDGLYVVDMTTWVGTRVLALPMLVALEAMPDGTLYGAGGSDVYRIDPAHGATKIAQLYTFHASGDLAYVGGRLLGTATREDFSGPTLRDWLIEINPDAPRPDRVHYLREITVADPQSPNDDPVKVFGLAASPKGELFGLTYLGLLLAIDTRTAASLVLGHAEPKFLGATTWWAPTK
jgi:hypothetical protein